MNPPLSGFGWRTGCRADAAVPTVVAALVAVAAGSPASAVPTVVAALVAVARVALRSVFRLLAPVAA